MINHTDIKALISADYDGQTSQEEHAIVEQHLKGCASCREYARQLRKLSATLDQWTNEDLSPDLERNIQKGLEEVSMSGQTKKITQKSLFKVGVGGGVLVTILVLALSMQVYIKRGVQGRLQGLRVDELAGFSPGDKIEKRKIVRDVAGKIVRVSQEKNRNKEQIVAEAPMLASKKMITSSRSNDTFANSILGSELLERRRDGFERMRGGFQESSYLVGTMMDKGRVAHSIDNQQYYQKSGNTEQYDRIYENEFLTVGENPLSTFSIDVDTASYSNMRRFLNYSELPPKDAVRIEELINYFRYDYPKPQGEDPFSITTDAAVCPWNKSHQLVRIGLQGKTLDAQHLKPSNLVFLIDVSGSMDQPNKLPLLKTAFQMMVSQLSANERVAIVVYAGAAGTVLESTPGSDKGAIFRALNNLQAGGSTAGGAGIQLAYNIARQNFITGGNNRVILATDGDFNVGASSNAEMIRLIEKERDAGVFLTVLGFGSGNYKDSRMEGIADKGNGNYYYIDTHREAQKVLVSELGSTLFTIAKDVKIQIEFNPSQIKAYRLIGYENRILAKEDFNDDTKDAGELGAGHTVTALYEIVPADSEESFGNVDALVYQKAPVKSGDLMTVKLRYKDPDGSTSKLIQRTVSEGAVGEEPEGDFQFASAVAEFGLLLRDSKFKGNASYDHVLKNSKKSLGSDEYGYRLEFINLVEKAKTTKKRGVIINGYRPLPRPY